MRIRLLAFASAGDAVGREALDVELPDGSTVSSLRHELDVRFPDLAPLWPRLAIAVDGDVTNSDVALHEGAEVALLPPVSGGSPGVEIESAEAITARLVEEPINVESVARAVEHPSCGAVVLFLGNVRQSTAQRVDHVGASTAETGKRVSHLDYSAYRPMAEKRLRAIVTELSTHDAGARLAIVHRLGAVAVGETSVVIAAASPHRDLAYEVTRQALERLKAEVPIWKKEHYADGAAVWREEETLRQT